MASLHLFDHTDPKTWPLASNSAPLYPIIAPSILSADFADLYNSCLTVLTTPSDEQKTANDSNGVSSLLSPEWLHCDVMDGHFVPNISFGFCVLTSLRKRFPRTFFDVHCMIQDPLKYLKDVQASGASQMTFHVEVVKNFKDAVIISDAIRSAKMQVGIAVKPSTPLDINDNKKNPSKVTEDETDALLILEALIQQKKIDMLLLMTVEPGFGGQPLIESALDNVKYFRQKYPSLPIQVDGGVDEKTIKKAAEAGANVMVAGTAVFKAKEPKVTVERMRSVVQEVIEKGKK